MLVTLPLRPFAPWPDPVSERSQRRRVLPGNAEGGVKQIEVANLPNENGVRPDPTLEGRPSIRPQESGGRQLANARRIGVDDEEEGVRRWALDSAQQATTLRIHWYLESAKGQGLWTSAGLMPNNLGICSQYLMPFPVNEHQAALPLPGLTWYS